MKKQDWFREAVQRASIGYQLSDELLVQKLELVDYYSFIENAPADVRHEYIALQETEIASAANSVLAKLRRGNHEFPRSRAANQREILIDWAARIRALDELVFENADLTPLSSERWRVTTTAKDVYLVPRWRPRTNPKHRTTGSLRLRGMTHHRIIPAQVGDWRTNVVPCRGRLAKSNSPKLGAGLFPDFQLKCKDQHEIIGDDVECNRYSDHVMSHLRLAHEDECHVLMYPELTIIPQQRAAIASALLTRPWDSTWSTSLVIAGSWHDRTGAEYVNVATAFSGYGDVLATHRKIIRYFDNGSGRPEGITTGDNLTVLVFDDLIVAIGICRDFCERSDPKPNPLVALDADLFAIPSMGNVTTLNGHLETAREIERDYRASPFVVQQSEVSGPLGFVIFPSSDLTASPQTFATTESWSTDTVDKWV